MSALVSDFKPRLYILKNKILDEDIGLQKLDAILTKNISSIDWEHFKPLRIIKGKFHQHYDNVLRQVGFLDRLENARIAD